MKNISRPGGFTLVELLIVVAIIGILAALLFPAATKAIDAARKATCAANLRTIGSAIALVATEEDGRLPGRGSRSPTGALTSWQNVLNEWVFKSDARPETLQVLGDKPLGGKMYCGAMKPWGKVARFPRAYVMNAWLVPIIKAPLTAEAQVPEYRGLYQYDPGLRLVKIPHPSRTVCIIESERAGDFVNELSPFGQITMGNGTNAPAWASADQNWAFRHTQQMNILFVDGHVETRGLEAAKELNNERFFNPAKQ